MFRVEFSILAFMEAPARRCRRYSRNGCPGWIRTTSKGIKNPYAAITSPDNGVYAFNPKALLRKRLRNFTSLCLRRDGRENGRAAAAYHRTLQSR